MEILSRYIRQQKKERNETISYMQIIVAAYVRAVSRNPEVNRFIMNKQLFARNNCSAAFTILKDPNDADKGEAVVKIKFDLTDTLYDVRDRMTPRFPPNGATSRRASWTSCWPFSLPFRGWRPWWWAWSGFWTATGSPPAC